MKIIIFIIAIFFVLIQSVFSQNIIVSGVVVDKYTKAKLPNATLKVGNKNFYVDNTGNFKFAENLNLLKKEGIYCTSIGYSKVKISYVNTNFYAIELEPKTQTLNEVIINNNAETLVEKAIRKIPNNYPTKNFMMEGILRIKRIINDTVGAQEFYKNDAVLKIFHPSYLNGRDPEVSLVQNNFIFKQSNNITKTSKLVDAYLVPVANFVYRKSDFVNLKKLKNYNYTLNGKTKINNHTAYVIAFSSIKNNTNEIKGLMYIDTATYTFLSAKYEIYNERGIDKQPYSKLRIRCNIEINFKEENKKWFLDRINVKNAYKNNFRDGEITFLTTSIDTVNVKPLAYPDIIQRFTEDLAVNNVVDSTWPTYQNIFNDAEKKGLLPATIIPNIKIDSSKNYLKAKAKNHLAAYLHNNNYRITLGFSQLPLNFDSYQPIFGTNILAIAQFAFYSNTQIRIYKNLFAELGGHVNFGLGGVNLRNTSYGLTYDFLFNKRGHPMSISPSVDYEILALIKQKQEYFKQQNLKFSINLAYELTHKYSLIVMGNYNHKLNEVNDGLLLTTQKTYPTIGIMYKIN